jgi:hypothetical protein
MPSTLPKRPCAYCRLWFVPSPRLKGSQYACAERGCQRRRKADNQRAWKHASRSARAAKRTYDEVSRTGRGDSITPQVPSRQRVDQGVSPTAVGDSIVVQGRILVGLVARLSPGRGGDSFRASLSELHDQGRCVLGGLDGKAAPR